MVSVTAVQYPPVYYSLERSIARATELISWAASEGIGLLLFPEGWIPGYPDFVWSMVPSNNPGAFDELYRRLYANSVDLSKNALAPVCEAARDHGVVVVMCVNECAGETSAGTIYNTAVTIDATGEILNVHRKVMPTNAERTVWGFGDGRGINVVETAVGRVGVRDRPVKTFWWCGAQAGYAVSAA